jgi:hypothetical protein
MALARTKSSQPRWYLIPVRVLLLTFLFTLLSFAVSLLLGILGTVIVGRLRGVHSDITVAYRHVAIPAAAAVGAIALISSIVMEVRHYQQGKALDRIERIS